MFNSVMKKISDSISPDTKVKLVIGASALSIITGSFTISDNSDLPGIFASEKAYMGRTKNALAALTAGLIAEKLNQNSEFNFELEKNLWPDANAVGAVKDGQIDSLVDLTFTSARYTGDSQEGNVSKSEFDWDIKQVNANTWHVGRLFMKFDCDLVLNIDDGKITGTFVRSGNHFDWGIEGTYDQDGNVEVDFSVPFSTDFSLRGKVE